MRRLGSVPTAGNGGSPAAGRSMLSSARHGNTTILTSGSHALPGESSSRSRQTNQTCGLHTGASLLCWTARRATSATNAATSGCERAGRTRGSTTFCWKPSRTTSGSSSGTHASLGRSATASGSRKTSLTCGQRCSCSSRQQTPRRRTRSTLSGHSRSLGQAISHGLSTRCGLLIPATDGLSASAVCAEDDARRGLPTRTSPSQPHLRWRRRRSPRGRFVRPRSRSCPS